MDIQKEEVLITPPQRTKQAVKDELNGKLNPNGTNQHSNGGVDIINPKNSYMKGSTGEAYIISRLKRDNPEMAQKVHSF